jgi:predicted amidohydrolase
MWIIGGSMPLVSPDIAAERVYGACPVYDADGKATVVYRKIHLFDVDLVDLLRPAIPGDVSTTRRCGLGHVHRTGCVYGNDG